MTAVEVRDALRVEDTHPYERRPQWRLVYRALAIIIELLLDLKATR